MDQATIAGCRAKVERAQAAAEEMNEKWLAWVATNPYSSRIELDEASGAYCVFYDFSHPAVPLQFPVLLGEIAHDLRYALDHLVWREAVEHLGLKRAEKVAARVTFPIERSRKKFAQSVVKRLVDDEAWQVIERYQPYDRGSPERSKALELLHWINRMDKHRFIHGSRVLIAHSPLGTYTSSPGSRKRA
jgi:hypothetical protein